LKDRLYSGAATHGYAFEISKITLSSSEEEKEASNNGGVKNSISEYKMSLFRDKFALHVMINLCAFIKVTDLIPYLEINQFHIHSRIQLSIVHLYNTLHPVCDMTPLHRWDILV